MTGKELKLKGTQQDFDPQSGQPIVTLQFNGQGQQGLPPRSRATRRIRGRTLGSPQHFAIVLDNEISVVPADRLQAVPGRDRPDRRRRADHRARARSARRRTSRSCSRPARCRCKFVTVERTDVSATLGKDSLRQARNAAIVGLLLVAIFLLADLPLPRRSSR